MTNVIMPFLMSMLLGRTIDLTSYKIGSNIYDDADYVQTPINTMNASYMVLQEHTFPYSYFGLPVDIVLRIKSNFLSSASGIMGLDGLLKDTSWKYNSVIVAVTGVSTKGIRTLKKDAPLLSNWQERIPDTQTHYANSVTYGGWCILLLRFRCNIQGDVEIVRRTLLTTLGPIGEVDKDSLEKYQKAMNAITNNPAIRGHVKVEFHVYSTAQMKYDASSAESVINALLQLPQAIEGIGKPMFMELVPLRKLDQRYPEPEESNEMLTELEKLDEMFDDFKNTKVLIMRWLAETTLIFTDEEEKRISEMLESVNDCIRAFSKVNADVSLYKAMDHNLLDDAFIKYMKGLKSGINNYNLSYRRLREEIDATCKDEFLHKIKGLLRVYNNEKINVGKVKEGLRECQEACYKNKKCRSIGYAESLTELDVSTGLYEKKEKQCWVYFRSTSTATVYTPSGVSGDLSVYDRNCI